MGFKAHSRPGRSRQATERSGNAWHQGFIHLVLERQPPSFAVRSEVELSQRPGRVDLVIERRMGVPPRDHEAGIMRSLWPRLSEVTLLEFKSPTRGFRESELTRLVGYGWQYFAKHWGELTGREALTLVLVVPSINQALRNEIRVLECECQTLERGYAELHGLGYTTYMVVTDEAADAEDDDYLRIFSHRTVHDPGAMDWLQDWLALQEEHMPQAKRTRSFQEMRNKYLRTMSAEERLAGLSADEVMAHFKPEERLEGLGPEERLAGLGPEERLAGLGPEERLAGLTAEQVRAYLESLTRKARARPAARKK
jgi:hypothetical protein